MALSAATILNVRTGGSDTNGGGFVAGASGTDWSLQDAAQYSVTDGVTNGTTTITSATANFGTDVVGNLIYVQGGTGSVAAGWYEIVSRTNSTTIVVDRSTGLTAGTGVTLIIGGALASPGQASGIATVAGHKIYVKSGTYTITSSSANVAAGRVSLSAGVMMEGYQTTKGDLAARPVISAGAVGSISIVTMADGGGTTNSQSFLINMDLDGNSQSSVVGVTDSSSFGVLIYLCIARNCTTGFSAKYVHHCTAISCTTGFSISFLAWGCYAKAGTTGFSSAAAESLYAYCIANDQSGDGFSSGNYQNVFTNCIAYSCGGDGFDDSSFDVNQYVNCIAYGNGGYGFKTSTGSRARVINCAYGSNTSGNFQTSPFREIGGASLSGDPFTDGANDDFSLDSTANEGAACRAAGLPGAFPGTSTTGYLDIGAVQHQDSGGSSGGGPLLGGRLIG